MVSHGKVLDDHVLAISSGGAVRTPTKRERAGTQKKPFVWETSSPRSPAAFRLLRAQNNHAHYGGIGSLSPFKADFPADPRRPFARLKGLNMCLAVVVGVGIAVTVVFLFVRALSHARLTADGQNPRSVNLPKELILGNVLARPFLGAGGGVEPKWGLGIERGFDLRNWAQSSPGPTQETVMSERKQWENAHALFRNRTGSRANLQALQWDEDIRAFAEEHVNKVRKENRCRLTSAQNNNRGYGENLYWSAYESGPDEDPFLPLAVVEEWFNTGNSYDYKENSCMKKKDCAPYCQLMWDKTRRFGCAMAECPYDGAFEGRQQIFACYYYPPMERGGCTHLTDAQRPF